MKKRNIFLFCCPLLLKILLLMKMLPPKLIGLCLVIAGLTAKAQLKFPVTNNDLRNNLSKIISDYPNQFASLKGDTITSNPQTIEFASKLNSKEVKENLITQYKSSKPVYSWQGLLLNTENFEEASKKYKWLYNQLQVMTVKLEGGYSFTLSGNYDAPDENKKFFSSVFKLTPNASNMPKLKIEASMQYEFPEWKVNLLVYEKEREDNERGAINGD